MNLVRDAIVATLRVKLPEIAQGIHPFIGLLDEQSEEQISYVAPGILVCVIEAKEAPENVPWELQGDFALVISVKAASALERDKAGWQLAMKAARVAYRNTWGINMAEIRPAIITGIGKNVARDASGTPTGVNYWTVPFYNWLNFEALISP